LPEVKEVTMAEDPGKEKVRDLVEDIHDGEYVIPHFQRGYEWQPSMVSDLFVSIIQDYFAGLLLFWELSDDRVDTEVWDSVWGAPRTDSPSRAILDGQQRLASLYYAIQNPRKEFPNRKTYYTWYLNLGKCLNEQYEEAVDYRYSFNYRSTKKFRDESDEWSKEGILPLALLSDSDFLKSDLGDFVKQFVETREKQILDLDPWETFTELFNLVQGVLNYEFITTTLSEDRDIHDICNIFARINQKGMRLSTFDLMNAFLFPHGIQLREQWEKLDNRKLKQVDRNMNEYLLKLISLHVQGYCSSKYIYNLIPEEKTKKRTDSGQIEEKVFVETTNKFLELWKNACRYAEEAREKIMNVGKHDFGAVKSKFIPNTTIVPVLGAVLWESQRHGDCPDPDLNKALSKWYWSATLSGDYSGSSDTVMAEDFRDWQTWFSERAEGRRTKGVNEKFINELDLKGTTRGAQYNAILCMLALNGAQDFWKGWPLDTGDYSGERINDHHIFPTRVKGLSDTKSFKECKDSILNRTLLLDETNKHKIGNKKPSVYLSELISEGVVEGREELEKLMEAHFISGAALDCLFDDDFDGFIAEREKAIKKHILTLIYQRT
jgi:hypothetical protein